MAIIVGSIRDIANFSTSQGTVANAAGKLIVACQVQAVFTGTYDNTAGVSIANIGAAVGSAKRDNRVYTCVQAGFAAPGVDGDVAPSIGHTLVGFGPATVSGDGITGRLMRDDMVTEWPNTTSVDTSRAPVLLTVVLTVSAN